MTKTCPVCNNLIKIEGPQSYGSIEPGPLKERALSGKCPTCPLLFEAVEAIQSNANEIVVSIDLANRLGVNASDGTLFLKVKFESGGKEVFELYSVKDYFKLSFMKPFQKIKCLRDIPGDTSSRASLDWVKKRVKECNANHTECLNNTEPVLPTRILRLSETVTTNSETPTPSVKLLKTNDLRAPYFCLSHCWGSSLPLRTTTLNLSSHLTSIPWCTLPLTYRDAILFTLSMGIQYLWIDSLCIVQDSPSDWSSQSSRMGSIYASSSLVLAAATATSASSGAFSLSPSHKWSQTLPVIIKDQDIEFRIRRQVKHDSYLSYQNFHSQAPLFDRAWIFQERILAPRVLFFMQAELIYRCIRHTVCECSSSWLVHDKNWLYDPSTQHPSSWARHWHDWVHLYSRLSLTYKSDKLPAISGLASEVRKLTNGGMGSYMAGLWRETIWMDLLWYVLEGERRGEPEQAEKRVPSWSWVKVDGRVAFRESEGLKVQSAKFLDVMTEYMSRDMFGQVSSSHLELEGFLKEVKLRSFTDGATPEDKVIDWRIYHVFAVGDPQTGDFVSVSMDTQWDTSTSAWVPIDKDLFQYRERLYCFKIGESSITSFSLLLRAVEGSKSVYERVGLVAAPIGKIGHEADGVEKVVVTLV